MEVDSTKNEYSACQSSETTLREANGKFAKEVLEFQVCFFPLFWSDWKKHLVN